MSTEKIEINGVAIWLTIDPQRIYDANQNLIEKDNEFFCYFKETEPNSFNMGELFKDIKGIPIAFKTYELAKQYAISELNNFPNMK